MHLTEDFPISSRQIRKTFRDEQKMNPNSARNIWKLLAQTRPEPDPNPNPTRKTRPDSNCDTRCAKRDRKTNMSDIIAIAFLITGNCDEVQMAKLRTWLQQ